MSDNRAGPALSPAGTVRVLIPATSAEARSGWRRLITGHAPDGTGSRALLGPFLHPGYACTLPLGAMVVTCDKQPDRWLITASTVTSDGLQELHTPWVRRSPLGQREVKYLAKRLAPDAARHTVIDRERPNKEPGRCRICGQQVPAGEGILTGTHGSWRLVHRSQCPPRPAELPTNRFAGRCTHCNGWVEVRTGYAVLVDSRPPVEPTDADKMAGRYRPAHHAPCPENAPPGPPTAYVEWCASCRQRMPAGAGYWDGRLPRHRNRCADPLPGPTWIVRRRTDKDIPAGTVLRARFTPGPGEPAIPTDAPGARLLGAGGFGELIAVVIDAAVRPGRRTRAQIRPASWTEAEALLAEDLSGALTARPAAQGFTARFVREQIAGDRPWLAEITGRDPLYGFQRSFLRAQLDANPDAPRGRGVWYCWTLAPNRVYQASWPTEPFNPRWRELRRRGWSGRMTTEQRAFVRTTAEGDVVDIEEKEVEAWLTHAPVWAATPSNSDGPR